MSDLEDFGKVKDTETRIERILQELMDEVGPIEFAHIDCNSGSRADLCGNFAVTIVRHDPDMHPTVEGEGDA